VQWPGRVGGDEFDLYGFALSEIAEAVMITLLQYLCYGRMVGHRAEKEINKTGTGDFDFAHLFGFRQCRDQFFRQIAGFAVCDFAQYHGKVTGEIAVFAVTGALEIDFNVVFVRQNLPGFQGLDCLRQ